MKRLFSIVLISALLISMIPGASPALAQSAKGVKVSTVTVSANRTARQAYSVTDSLMDELDRLVQMLRKAENEGDRELTTALEEKIKLIKEEISKASRKTTNTETSTETSNRAPAIVRKPQEPQPAEEETQPDEEKPTVFVVSGGSVVRSVRTDSCEEMTALEAKKRHYEALYALSYEELKDKGYQTGKDDISNTIQNLEEELKRSRIECEAGKTNRAGESSWEDTRTSTTRANEVAITLTPIVAESGVEITDYYKRRIVEIATEETDTEEKVAVLKELRNEIDRLIEELIKSKDEINISEVSGLVTTIQVRPGEVKMDEVTVKTIDKRVVARINDKDLIIKPTNTQVIVNEGNLEIKAQELSIENDALRVGNSEVKLAPSTVLEKTKIQPKEIELKEENSRAVYKIKTNENRKMLGFIPMEVEKTVTVDAADAEAEIIKETRPWWAFLTTK